MRPKLKLRLDQRRHQTAFLEPAHAGRQDQRQGNERDIGDDDVHRLGNQLFGSRA